MTTFSKEQIEKTLEKRASFTVASVQREFGLGYEKARRLVDSLVREKKADPLPDGVSFSFESALKKAQKRARKTRSPFERFFNRPQSPDKIAQKEIDILVKIYEFFSVEIEQGDTPHSYSLKISHPTGAEELLYLDLYNDNFRIHDGRQILDTYTEPLKLDTIEGATLMTNIMSDYSALASSNDGRIGAQNITPDNVCNVIEQLMKLLRFLGKLELGGFDEVLKMKLEELDSAISSAFTYLAVQVHSRTHTDAISFLEKAIADDHFDTEEQDDMADFLLKYVKDMSAIHYSSKSGAILNPRLKKFKYIPK